MNLNTASHLLIVEKMKSGGYRMTRLYPACVAILNLFLCAYFERYFKFDVSVLYLSIYLFIESATYVIASSSIFFTIVLEILWKCRVFPSTPTDRSLFVIASNLRRPLLFSFISSNVFFLAILFRQTPLRALLAVGLFVAMIVVTEILLSTTLLVLMRRSMPFNGIIIVLGLIFLSVIAGSIIFHDEMLVLSIPIVQWTTDGIIAASHGNTAGFLASASWLVSTGAVTVVIAGRLA